MEELSIEYLDPPTEGVFFNAKPERGYRLVESGTVVDGDFLPVKGSPKTKVLPREGELPGLLLLPIGRRITARNAYFVEEEEKGKGRGRKKDFPKAFFQRFAELESDEEILTFASEFGPLRPGIPLDFGKNGQIEAARLESVSEWKLEASFVRAALRLIGDHDDSKDLSGYISRFKDSVILKIHAESKGENIKIPIVVGETLKRTVYRGLVVFFNRMTKRYPSTPQRILYGDSARSVFVPENLLAAVWLQASQAFFHDGPSKTQPRRCFVSGFYFKEEDLAVREAGPHKGRLYHPGMKHRFYQQKNAQKKAEARGREIKPGRKGKTEFLVDEF